MILKYGLNLNKKKTKKTASVANPFDQLNSAADSERSVATQIATQSERQRQKAEQEKLKLLAEDPNVYAFDEVYESMAEKKRGQIAAKINADADRKPKYFDQLAKRCEERKIEQGVVYQRGIVKERIAEDKLFSKTEAFITSSYKAQMIKDKAWQTQQDIIDRRNKGPTTAGMAGGFLAHLLNDEPVTSQPQEASPELESVAPSATAEEEQKTSAEIQEPTTLPQTASKPEKETAPSTPTESSLIGVKRHRELGEEETAVKEGESTQGMATDTVEEHPVIQAPSPARPSKEELAAAARERYLKRKAERRTVTPAP